MRLDVVSVFPEKEKGSQQARVVPPCLLHDYLQHSPERRHRGSNGTPRSSTGTQRHDLWSVLYAVPP